MERALDTSDGVGAQLPARAGRAPAGWCPGGDLTPLEEEMVASAAAGEVVDRGKGPFNQAGCDKDGRARKVAIARRADLRKYGELNPYRKFGNWLLDKTIKYGYQTWRAGVVLVVVFVAFLYPAGYTVDTVIPLINVHQADY
jgi:hypothetical protein